MSGTTDRGTAPSAPIAGTASVASTAPVGRTAPFARTTPDTAAGPHDTGAGRRFGRGAGSGGSACGTLLSVSSSGRDRPRSSGAAPGRPAFRARCQDGPRTSRHALPACRARAQRTVALPPERRLRSTGRHGRRLRRRPSPPDRGRHHRLDPIPTGRGFPPAPAPSGAGRLERRGGSPPGGRAARRLGSWGADRPGLGGLVMGGQGAPAVRLATGRRSRAGCLDRRHDRADRPHAGSRNGGAPAGPDVRGDVDAPAARGTRCPESGGPSRDRPTRHRGPIGPGRGSTGGTVRTARECFGDRRSRRRRCRRNPRPGRCPPAARSR